MIDKIDPPSRDRQALEPAHGKVWNEEELAEEFHVKAIIFPQVVVQRKADLQVGCLTFQNNPRYYYDFKPSPGFGEA